MTLPPGPAPLYVFVQKVVDRWINSNSGSIVIGLSAPQGSGKTFAVTEATKFLGDKFPSVNVVPVSMDDVYLSHEQQVQLTKHAMDNGDNKLLQGRGLPGTHDLKLLKDVIYKVRNGTQVRIPQYDKSAFDGEGDRLPESQWPVHDKVDVLLVEGWFNGYMPISSDVLKERYGQLGEESAVRSNELEHLIQINELLKDYVSIWQEFDYFVNFETADVKNVFTWRVQQEHDLIAKKGTGMSDEEVKRFINRYMAMYELYYRDLCGRRIDRSLNIVIDIHRRVLGSTEIE